MGRRKVVFTHRKRGQRTIPVVKNVLMEGKGITFQDKGRTWETAADAKTVVKYLNQQNPVHYLNLEGNTLSVDAAEVIGEALSRHPEFRLALWKNVFKRYMIPEIPLSLKHLGRGLIAAGAKLVVLELTDNPIGPTGMLALAELLRSPVCYSLDKLLLNNCVLEDEGATTLSKALIELYGNAEKAGSPLKLRTFVGGRNNWKYIAARELATAFKVLKTLEEVTLTENLINHESVGLLAESFKENPNLQVLKLNENRLRGSGAAKIAEILPSLSQLREIDLSECFIRNHGAHKLAKAFEGSNEMLQTIYLDNNEIHIDGGLALVAAMKNKPKLRLFNIDYNYFGPEGCQQVRAAMEQQQKGVRLEVYYSSDLPFPTATQDDSEVYGYSEEEDEEEPGPSNQSAAFKKPINHAQSFKEPINPAPEVKEPINPAPAVMEPINPTPAVKEPINPAPAVMEPINPAPPVMEPINPAPAVMEPINPAPEVKEPINPAPAVYDPINPAPEVKEPINPAPAVMEPINPAPAVKEPINPAPPVMEPINPAPAFKEPSNPAVKEFVSHRKPCTLEQFNALGSANKLKALQSMINDFTNDHHMLLLVFTSIKCAHLSQASKEALELAISLFHLTFDYATKNNQEARVVNYVLQQLGLNESKVPEQEGNKKEEIEETIQLKDRKRSFTTAELEDEQGVAGKRQRQTKEPPESDFDLQSCRFALREAIRRPEFATDTIKNMLKEPLNKIDV